MDVECPQCGEPVPSMALASHVVNSHGNVDKRHRRIFCPWCPHWSVAEGIWLAYQFQIAAHFDNHLRRCGGPLAHFLAHSLGVS